MPLIKGTSMHNIKIDKTTFYRIKYLIDLYILKESTSLELEELESLQMKWLLQSDIAEHNELYQIQRAFNKQ